MLYKPHFRTLPFSHFTLIFALFNVRISDNFRTGFRILEISHLRRLDFRSSAFRTSAF